MLQQFVQVVAEGGEHGPFEFVGADLDLFPECPACVGELLVGGHQPSALEPIEAKVRVGVGPSAPGGVLPGREPPPLGAEL